MDKEERVINLCKTKGKMSEGLIKQYSHKPTKIFSPLRIPLERRAQTCAVLSFVLLTFFLLGLNLFILFFPPLWIPYLLYLGWMVYDLGTPNRGGRRPLLREIQFFWQQFRDYFPSQAIEVEKLDPKKKYVFAVHPHGIFSCSVFANLLNNFSGILKGIDYRVCTLNANFYIPFWREWLLGFSNI